MESSENKKQAVIKELLAGRSMAEVEEAHGLTHRTVLRWLKDFQSGNLELSDLNNKASIRYQRLSAGQIKWFDLVLRTKSPLDFNLKKALWDRNLATKLLQSWCKKTFPTNEIYTLIEELGFALTDPRAAVRSSDQSTHEWMKSDWPGIEDEFTQNGYRILWLGNNPLAGQFQVIDDKVSKQGAYIIRKSAKVSDTSVTYAYYPTQKRFYFIATPHPASNEVAIQFLTRLEQDHPRPCLLVVSKASMFNSPAVIQHVNDYSSNFKLLATP